MSNFFKVSSILRPNRITCNFKRYCIWGTSSKKQNYKLLSSAILIGQPRTFPKISLMHEINQLLLYSWNQRYSMWERANAAEQWSLLSFLREALLNSHRIEIKVLCYVTLKTTKLNLGKKLLFLVCTPFFFFFWQLPTLSWNA